MPGFGKLLARLGGRRAQKAPRGGDADSAGFFQMRVGATNETRDKVTDHFVTVTGKKETEEGGANDFTHKPPGKPAAGRGIDIAAIDGEIATPHSRRRFLLPLGGLVVVGALTAGGWLIASSGGEESTTDATPAGGAAPIITSSPARAVPASTVAATVTVAAPVAATMPPAQPPPATSTLPIRPTSTVTPLPSATPPSCSAAVCPTATRTNQLTN